MKQMYKLFKAYFLVTAKAPRIFSIFLFVAFLVLFLIPFQDIFAQNNLNNVGLPSGQAVAAYSIRKVTSTYSGPCVKVRRTDNTELNIGFNASGDIDQAALLTFVGTGDGFVVTWYDQSGNGRNANQTTIINQPKIVSAGILEVNGNRPAIKFGGGTQNLNNPFTLVITNYPVTISLLANTSGGATNGAFVKFGSDPNFSGFAIGIGTSGGNYSTAGKSVIGLKDNITTPACPSNPDITYPSTPFTSTTIQLEKLTTNTSPLSTFLNGTSINLANSTTNTKGTQIKGALSLGGFTGTNGGYAVVKESEVIIFASALSVTDRETLECNQLLYYGILTSAVGSNQNICGSLNSMPLGGVAPSYGTGRWVQTAGPINGTTIFSSDIDGNSTATASEMGTYTYSWEVSNGSCIAASNVTVTYSKPPTAGINQHICGLPRLSNPLGGNTPAVGTGNWSKVSGPGIVTFSDVNNGNSTAEVDADGTYIFRWSITGGFCSPDYVDVTVVYNSVAGVRPTGTISGNASICPGTSTTLMVNLTGSGPWNLSYTDGITIFNTTTNVSPFTFGVTPANAGSYTLVALSDANCIAQPSNLSGSAVITFSPNVIITADYCSQGNGIVKLDAGAHYSYLWSPGGATTRTVNVAQSGYYSVTVKDSPAGCAATGSFNVGEELVFNGDFSLGNVGFVTQYQVPTLPLVCANTTTALYPEGKYDIKTDARLTHCNFWGKDHTTGTGNYMIVNGANTIQQIWKTNNIQVQKNTRYYFSAWAMSLNAIAPFAALRFNIGNYQYGITAVLAAGLNNNSNKGWTRFYGQWDSGDTTSITISIVNTNLANSGNDFGLDDISFSTIPPVTFAAAPLANGGNSFCPNDTLELTPNLIGGASPFTYNWTGPSSFSSTDESPVILLANAAQAGIYTLTATDVNGCVATGAVNVISATPNVGSATQPAVCNGSPVLINLTGLVPNSINNSVSYKITAAGTVQLATGISVDATGNASFTIPWNSTIANNQVLFLNSINNGSCIQNLTLTITLNILSNGWVGGPSGNWTVASNWCPAIPNINSDVTVPTGTTISINAADIATCRNITLNGTGSVIVNKGVLKINGIISTPSTGKINAANGIINMAKTSAQTISGDNFTGQNISVLQLSNTTSSGIVTISSVGPTLKILSALSFVNNSAGLITNDKLIIGSTDTATAWVGPVATGNVIVGNVTVERYFPAKRSWRLITSPLSNTGSFYDSWQNGGTYIAGKGTFITGPNPTSFNGLDASFFNNVSLKKGSYFINILNTKTTNLSNSTGTPGVPDNIGYFMFIRGDRNPANTNPSNSNVTTLSSKGKLQTGTQTFTVSSFKDSFTLIGNPYASPVSFKTLTKNNIVNRFVIWDPNLNQVGGYVTVEDPLNTGTYSYTPQSPGGQDSIIQSGQAFFVQTASSGSASLVFNENNKSSKNNTAIFRPLNVNTGSQGIQKSMRINLLSSDIASSKILSDGVSVEFDNKSADAVDMFDAIKFHNVNEELAFLRNGSLLTVERRPELSENDTLFLRFYKTNKKNYSLQFLPINLDPTISAFLDDKFTATSTPLSLITNSEYNFEVNDQPLSTTPDRFRIIFKRAMPAEFSFNNVKANQQDEKILIEWQVSNDAIVSNYIVERSIDGINFKTIAIKDPIAKISGNTDYSLLDNMPIDGIIYYRIKMSGTSGTVEYSSMVKVNIVKVMKGITVYPNPVTGNAIKLACINMPTGIYQVKLHNNIGQLLFTWTFNHLQGNKFETVKIDNKLKSGIYHLQLTGPSNYKERLKLLAE